VEMLVHTQTTALKRAAPNALTSQGVDYLVVFEGVAFEGILTDMCNIAGHRWQVDLRREICG
jgi:hypothetical protein